MPIQELQLRVRWNDRTPAKY